MGDVQFVVSGNQIHDTLCMRPAGARFELLISEFVQGDGPFCVICCPACEAIATERMPPQRQLNCTD